MNKELETSDFFPFPGRKITRSTDFFVQQSRPQDAFFSEGWDQKYFSKILQTSYAWIDSISGKESLFIDDGMEFMQPHLSILKVLQKESVVKHFLSRNIRYNDAPPFFRVNVFPRFAPASTDGRYINDSFGNGFSQDIRTAFSQAIGEFLERYFLTLYKDTLLMKDSRRNLRRRNIPFIDPDEVAGFSEEQKEKNISFHFSDDSVLSWIPVSRSGSSPMYIPAQFIFWNYLRRGEPFLREGNTNGAGGMFSPEGAILSGLYELIQRDGFLLYWMNSLGPRKIAPESIPDNVFRSLLRQSRRYGFKIHCLDTTSDVGIPSSIVVLEDARGFYPRFVMGGGCDADPRKSFRKALEEAWGVYYWIRSLSPFSLPAHYQAFSDNSIRQPERLRLWANPAMADKLSFFLRGKEVSFDDAMRGFSWSFSSVREEFLYAVSCVERLGPGYEVYSYLPRHRILRQLGYHSARVFVPQLVPLYLGEGFAPLGSVRLREFGKKHGSSEINPLPHPFP